MNARTQDPAPLAALAVVGMGPRGTAVLERLVAASTSDRWRTRLTVHCIDPHVGLGGAVWRHDQPPVLLMNTATAQTSEYPDSSTHPALPVLHRDTLADHAAGAGLGPADFAPRAQFGRYLAHVLERAEADADPQRLRIIRHRAEAIDATGGEDGPVVLRLSTGARISADAAVFALGHLATALGPRSRQYALGAERHGLLHVPPMNPLEVDYSQLLGRERIAVLGMGLNFYDLIGMLTHVADGRFVPDDGTVGGLRYIPGGGEPQLLVGSRSGMVYRPKPDLGAELPEPYEPRVLTGERVLELAVRPAGIDHDTAVLPLIMAELERALREAGHEDLASEERLLRVLFPFGRAGGPVAGAHERTVRVLGHALADAAGPDPAWLLAYRVLTTMKQQVNRLVDLGAYTTEAIEHSIDRVVRNAFASWTSGPPLLRARQVMALVDAGLLRFAGPGMGVHIHGKAGRFSATAGADVPEVLCDGVFEAHLPSVNLPAFTSPLVSAWRERGEVRRDQWLSRGSGTQLTTGAIDVAGLYSPIAEDGRVFTRRLMVGVPVSTAQPGSAITAEPGTGAQLLRHAEAVAIRAAQLAGALG